MAEEKKQTTSIEKNEFESMMEKEREKRLEAMRKREARICIDAHHSIPTGDIYYASEGYRGGLIVTPLEDMDFMENPDGGKPEWGWICPMDVKVVDEETRCKFCPYYFEMNADELLAGHVCGLAYKPIADMKIADCLQRVVDGLEMVSAQISYLQ